MLELVVVDGRDQIMRQDNFTNQLGSSRVGRGVTVEVGAPERYVRRAGGAGAFGTRPENEQEGGVPGPARQFRKSSSAARVREQRRVQSWRDSGGVLRLVGTGLSSSACAGRLRVPTARPGSCRCRRRASKTQSPGPVAACGARQLCWRPCESIIPRHGAELGKPPVRCASAGLD